MLASAEPWTPASYTWDDPAQAPDDRKRERLPVGKGQEAQEAARTTKASKDARVGVRDDGPSDICWRTCKDVGPSVSSDRPSFNGGSHVNVITTGMVMLLHGKGVIIVDDVHVARVHPLARVHRNVAP